MSLSSHGSRLSALTREFSGKWDETKNFWRDAKSREFEERYMKELLSAVENAAVIIEQLDKIVARIRSDCE